MRPHPGPRASKVRDLVDADRELALLRELIQAASSGPGSNRWPRRRRG